jgi:hypothetical protein
MSDHQSDWRVIDGPAIGRDPEFLLSDIRVNAHFFETGNMSRNISARLVTKTPTLVESTGRILPDMPGNLRIHSSRFLSNYRGVEFGPNRGVLALIEDGYVVELFLPPDQFESLLPLLTPPPPQAGLMIEVDKTLDQKLYFEEDKYFWNDLLSPLVFFNEFELSVPRNSGALA